MSYMIKLSSSKLNPFPNNLKFERPASYLRINPLPNMPILGSSDSAANKDITSKILTNGDTIF